MSKSQKLYSILICLIFIIFVASSNSTFAQTCIDNDSDGYGLNGDTSCPNPGVDCDDTDPNVYPDAPRICDGKDSDCDGFEDFFSDKDQDGDGSTLCTHWLTGLRDCNDSNPAMFPGNIEGPFGDATCSDGFDNDCDYRTDGSDDGCSINCIDSDNDGYGSPGNITCPNGDALDCNNTNPNIYPGAPDAVCDGVDNNCSGTPDDDYVPTPTTCGIGECARTGSIICVAGAESDTCVAGTPQPEVCSGGLDEDCDGLIDQVPGIEDPACGSCADNDLDGYGANDDPSCPNAGTDCDDNDPTTYPGAPDAVCNGVDNNCSGTADNEYVPPTTFCGIGECATTGLDECQAGVVVDTCSPLAPGTEGPFGDPTCSDTLDNDCDGVVDAPDNDCNPLDQDNDGDGFCEVGPCQNPANLGDDCDDTNPVVYPGAPRLCDAVDNDCDFFQDFFTDRDGDGDGATMCEHYLTGIKDCDDNNADRSPLIIEAPFGGPLCSDTIDNDCDYRIDGADMGCAPGCPDDDGDGFTDINCGGADCNDGDPNICPSCPDVVCDGVDNNCSGTPDDEYVPSATNCGVGECVNTGTLTCSGGVELDDCTPLDPSKEGPSWHPTCVGGLDEDCDGLIDLIDPDPGCQVTCLDEDGDGYGYYGDSSCPSPGADCDDDNAAINPGAPDVVCDGVDDNCNGTPDDEHVPPVTNCGIGECETTGLLVCNAGTLEDNCLPLDPGIEGPVGDPTCEDGLDNDCDGAVDQPDSDCNPPDQDNDGDGFCEVGPCQNPANLDGDCDDSDPLTYPAAPRLCDGKDNDCDDYQDFFTDRDADGDGSTMCAHWQTGLQDCDDNDPDRSPEFLEAFGMPECEDGIDNDCNFKTDLADPKCLTPCNDVDNDGFGLPGHPECPNGGQTDCNDNDSSSYPGAPDAVCNGIDNNCSGTPDDEYVPTATNCGIGECADTGTLICSGGVETDTCTPLPPAKEGPSWHPTCTGGLDEDCDGLIDLIDPDPGCEVTCLDEDGDGYGYYGDASCPNPGADCDDDNPAINPGIPDSNCDGADDNCSGTPDDEYVPTPTICGIGECSTTGQLECQGGVEIDTCIPLIPGIEGPAGDLTCSDILDNDCDTFIDNDDIDCNALDIDDDGDGYCEGLLVDDVLICSDGSIPGDCDDTDTTRNPAGNTTICDGKDTNCDTFPDFFTDVDNDGDGVPLCEHYLTGLADCDDSNPDRYPGNQEGPFGDPTCSDLIDNDCDFKTDGPDPDCQPPTCGTTVGQIKDGPHMFDLLDGGNNVLKTPCQWCHITDYQGTMIDERVECQRCHALASDTSDPLNGILKEQVAGPVNGNPAPTAYPADPPYGFGTAQDVKLHSSTVVGTTHGNWDMDCLTCHNPHQQEQDARYGTSYGKYIKEFICFDNTAIGGGNFEEVVEFTASTGTGAFADGPPYNENICNMCHTLTNHHRRDDAPPAPGGQDHNNDQNCTNCHPHDEGFKPFSVADAPHNNTANPGLFDLCSVCHVSEIDFTTPVPSANCLNCHDEAAPLKAGGGSDIKVRSHFIGTMECIECHNPMFEQINFRGNTNLSHVRTSVNGNEIAFEAKTGPFSFADDTNAAANGMLPENYICNTCHTTTAHHRNDGSLLPADQSHNDGIDCTGCHTHQGGTVVPDAFRDHIENSQADAPHNNTANPGLFDQCSVCHVAEDDYVTPVPNTKCLNCHSVAIGQTGPADSHHTAGDGSQCIDCHNPMREQINFRGNPNLSHIRSSINGTDVVLEAKTGDYGFAPNGSTPPDMTIPNYICNTCHTQTNHHQADGTAPLGQSHNNGVDCTLCHTHPGSAAPGDAFKDHPITIADQPHNSTATPGFNDDCNLCHVDGVSPGVPIPNTKCQGCHAVGTPDQAGGGANTKVETHHTPADKNCVDCHDPMGAQGANEFHISVIVNGQPISFTGTDPTNYTYVSSPQDGSGLCEVCHTSTLHWKSDGSGTPHFDTGCTAAGCHTHDTGMAPPSSLADAPHDTITDCTLCHDPGTYVDGATLDNNKCLGCHGPAGPATTVETHHTPADLACTDCHNPMNPQTNYRHIKSTVNTRTIVFGTPTTPASAGEYADGAGNGLCEVCHTTTAYYKSDGSGLSHNDGSVCTTCHTHPAGFVPPPAQADVPHDTITDCTLCHDPGTYVDGATLDNNKCLGCHGPAGPATTVETHHTPADLACTDCHNPMNPQTNYRHIKSTVDGAAIVFGTPTTPATGGEYADGLGNGLCEVCHDSLTLAYYNSDGSGFSHNDGSVCTTCHTHDTGMVPPQPLADTPHDTITDCTLCHDPGTYVDGATLDNNKCLGCHGPAGPATTVETHHTPADLACTDCHNPMNPQTNYRHIKSTVDGAAIVFGTPTTPATGGEYADGAGNGLCEVCHDSLTLAYYNSDGSGFSHNDGSVCTTCHTHDTGMVPPQPLADTPHDGITDCTLCHDPGTYVDGATLQNSKCLGCHGPAGPATTVETHHTPADLNCTDCHNPMNVQTNYRHIKSTINTRTVVFGTPATAPSASEYADEAGNGLCEICHTTTSYYRNDGSGLSHNSGAVCTTCHTHQGGFLPPPAQADVPHDTITDCTLCHDEGTYVDGATLDNNKCLGCHGPAGPATTVETHHTPADLNCTDCHNPMNPQTNYRHIKSMVDGAAIVFGTPTTPATGGEYADGLGNGLCEVCHDSLTLAYYNSDGSGFSHNDGSVCTTCHTHDTGMVPPQPLADTPHDTITDCTLCHDPGTYVDGATLDNNKCLGCHGPAGPATTVETHHTPADLACTDCHNPMNPQTNYRHIKSTVDGAAIVFGTPTTPATGGEYADGLGNGLCEVCHDSLTLAYYNSDGSGFSHNDGSVCTTCHTHDTGMVPPQPPADTPHDTITDCTLCHDPGTYVDGATLDNNKCLGCHGPAGPATTVETHHTPADLNCTDCHNPMNVQTNYRHIKSTINTRTVVFGTPATAPSASEYADESGNGLCEICHTTTSYYRNDGSGLSHNSGAVCTTCHTHPTGFVSPPSFADVPHDTITDCTLCHDPGTYVDNATLDNNKCLGCHGPAGPATTVETHHTPADLNCTDCHNPMNVTGTWKHVKPTVDGSLITFGTPTTAPAAGEYADGLGNGLCEVCHDSLTLDYYNSDGSGFPHNDGSVCTTCHTHDTGMVPPQPLADTPHDTITDCTLCHDPGTYVAGATLDNNKCLGCHGPAGPATTVETHHTPADLNCTDCHNPMNPQANIKHVKDSLTVFDGTAVTYANGTGSGVCEVCHTTTDYYRNDGTGFPHNAGSICTTCHTHQIGFEPPPYPADTPHDGITDCTLCHDPGTYVLDAAIPNSKCLGCHGPAGPATTVETHHTPADLNCVECHNPMQPQTGNLSHVRTTLAFFDGTPDSYADGLGNGVCEVCHTTTNYYKSDGSGFPHNEGSVCTTCHTHLTGFVFGGPLADVPHDTITDCTLCHDPGTYVAGATLDNNKCLGCHGPAGPATTVETHHTPADLNCTDCHNPMNATGNWKHIKPTVDGAAIVFGTPTTPATGGEYADGLGNGLCEVCHDSLTLAYYNSDGSGFSHNDGSVCTTCHTHDTGMVPPQPLADTPHDGITDCTLCHDPGTYVAGATLDNNKCLGCHGPAGPATTVETHHTPPDLNCTDCHNPMNPTGNWKHIKPTVDGATIVFGTPTTAPTAIQYADEAGNGLCEVCHDSLTLTYYNSDGSGLPHNAGAICTICHTHSAGFAPDVVVDAPHDTITDCTLCHDPGTYVDGATLDNAKCLGCHGPGGSTFDQTDDFTGLTTGDAGRPTFGNWTGVPGDDTTNGWMAWNGATASSGTGPSTGDYVVLESSPTVGSGGSNLNQNDGFTGLDTGATGRPVFGNWTGINGSDGTNGWMVWNGATASSGTGPSAGNPGEYVVLESSPTTGGGGGVPTVKHFRSDAGSGTYGGMTVTYTSCGVSANSGLVGTLSENASLPGTNGCSAGRVNVNSGNLVSTWVFTTAYTSDTTIDGGTVHFDFRERDGSSETVRFDIGYVIGGSFTSLGFATQNISPDSNTSYTINLGISGGIAPSGSVLALQMTNSSSNRDRVFFNANNPNGSISMTITETGAGGGDEDAVNGVDVTAGSEQYVVSNVIDAGAYVTMSTSFDWNMNVSANSDASLHLDAWNGTSWNLDITGGAVNTGNNGDTWTSTGSIDLSAYNNADFQLRIRYIVGTNGDIFHNDVAVDNIVILGTGPVGDEDPVNGVDVTAGSTQYLVSNVIDAGAYDTLDFTFDFNMNVNDNADASLHLDAWNGTGWDLDITGGVVNTGNAGDIWIAIGPVDLSTYTNADFQLRFRYIVGSGTIHQNDVAVDNLVLAGSSGGIATEVETHHTPADLNCTDCHNPMNVTGTWKHVKPTVDGSLITFGTPTTAPAAGEYADGAGNGLCEVCHDTLTLDYYNSDGSGFPHNDGSVCTTCHEHQAGFVPPIVLADTPHDTITDCTLCHDPGTYVDDATLNNNKCLGCHGPAGPATTVETHHTPPDLNCTDCHNPMNPTGNWKHIKPTVDGAPRTFGTPTTTPAAGEYADGLGNGLCEVCHDSLTLSYYNSDGSGLPHNDGAVCTSCHTHDAGFLPSSVADVPHDTITDCTLCHDPGTYVDDATLNNNKCLGCHGPAGPATTVETHHTPGDLNCTDCHNPMNPQTNIKHVKDTLAVFDGTPPTYADGNGNGVCEVCHTATDYYQNNGSGFPHNPGTVCTTCHTHLAGFVPPPYPADTPHDGITDCTLCHDPGTYVINAAIPNSKCLGCHGPAGPATTVETHHTPGDLNCVECHNPMQPQGANLSHVRTTLATFTSNATGAGFADGTGNGVCEVCHTATVYYDNTGTGSPHMTDVCTNCHTHGTGFTPPDDPADTPHDTITDCTECHAGDDYVLNAVLDNAKCLVCHGPAGTATLVETHHTPPDLNCGECHNVMRAQTGNLSHIKTTLAVFDGTAGTYANGTGSGVCEVCHTTTTYYRNDGSGASHNPGAICTSCHEHATGFVPTGGSCIDCHNGVPGGATYVTRDVVGVDFQQASRHVFGGTVTNWDCIVCHREGDEQEAALGNVATTPLHNNGGTPVVDMRDVDNIANTTIATDGSPVSLVWDKNVADDTMFTAMDYFCMSCHDSDGALGIAVKSDDLALTVTPTLAESERPFNSTDDVDEGIGGGTYNLAGYERTRVLDVFTQFDPANPSHHAVRGTAYNNHDSDWGAGAWVTNSLKSGQELTTVFETAQLHCADCHTVDSIDGGAHGGAEGFMLKASSIDGTCYLCHSSNVYGDQTSTLTRWSHDNDGSVWSDDGVLLGAYGGNTGSICLNCHGGNIGNNGTFVDGFGGIHGLSGTDARSGQIKFRFQGGSYMAHDPGDWTGTTGTATCYFDAGTDTVDWASCTKHSGTEQGRTAPPQYNRPTPDSYVP